VLVVSTYPPRRCGIGSYAMATVERMRDAGDRVVVLSPPDGYGDVRVPFGWGRQFLRAARLGSSFDLIQVHFQPGLYYRPGISPSKVVTSLSLLWLVLRRRQTEMVVHEFERAVLWRPDHFLLRAAFARARLAFHTDAERQRLEEDYRVRTHSRRVDHAEGVRITSAMGRDRARRHLSIPPEETVFLCAGFLHPDKGFERAVRAFPGPTEARLVILGTVRDPTPTNIRYARSLRELCEGTPGVSLIEDYVSDEDFDAWIQAADLLVLPYRRSWSSGALARAQRLGTPAIVSDVGGLPEQAGPNDLVFGSDEELAAALVKARGRAHARDFE
jgi:glycosyltransferase involved in cell wall biosynthesis